MKILMLLSNPLLVDPRVHKEAKALTEKGNEVTVIVWDRKQKYKKTQEIDGIKVIRIHNSKTMDLLPNDLFRNPLWWKKAYQKAKHIYKNDFKFDVVHCHDLDTLKPGVKLKKKFGVKLVYDSHEIFMYMIQKDYPVISRLTKIFEKRLIKKVNYIITVNKPFKEYYKKITDKPIKVVMNCKNLVYKKYEPAKNDVFTLVYIGIMNKVRFFPEIFDVIGNLENVKLILAGKKEGLYYEMKEYVKKYENIKFLGTIPTEDILKTTRESDLTFCILNPQLNKQAKFVVYNKQFEAMVCGRPILVSKGTYAGDMTEELKCGLTVEINKESIKDAIIKLRDNKKLLETLGKNAFKAAKERYNWEKEKKNLLKVYEAIK